MNAGEVMSHNPIAVPAEAGLAEDELRPGARVEFLTVEIGGKIRVSAMRLR